MKDSIRRSLARTAAFAIAVLCMSWLSAHNVSRAELRVQVRFDDIGSQCCGNGKKYQLTSADIERANKGRRFYFYIFSAALLPLLLCATKPRAQTVLAVLSLLVLLDTLGIGHGGDIRGCRDCGEPLWLSAFLSAGSTVVILAWMLVALVLHYVRRT